MRHHGRMGIDKIFFDEMYDEAGQPRSSFTSYDEWLAQQEPAKLLKKTQEAEDLFRKTGITFAVYGQEEAEERLIPFDIVPRIISAQEWTRLSRGIEQRVRALNASQKPGLEISCKVAKPQAVATGLPLSVPAW